MGVNTFFFYPREREIESGKLLSGRDGGAVLIVQLFVNVVYVRGVFALYVCGIGPRERGEMGRRRPTVRKRVVVERGNFENRILFFR